MGKVIIPNGAEGEEAVYREQVIKESSEIPPFANVPNGAIFKYSQRFYVILQLILILNV